MIRPHEETDKNGEASARQTIQVTQDKEAGYGCAWLNLCKPDQRESIEYRLQAVSQIRQILMNMATEIDTITCEYSCVLCGAEDVSFEVPIRQKNQDVLHWMRTVLNPAMISDHEARSPGCHPEVMSRLLIPAPKGSPMVGRPVEHYELLARYLGLDRGTLPGRGRRANFSPCRCGGLFMLRSTGIV